jgi:hypothetical protein
MSSNTSNSTTGRKFRDAFRSCPDGIEDVWLDDTSFYAVTSSSSRGTSTNYYSYDAHKAIRNGNNTTRNHHPLTSLRHSLRNHHRTKDIQISRSNRYIYTLGCLSCFVIIFIILHVSTMNTQEHKFISYDQSSTRFDRFPHARVDTTNTGMIDGTTIVFQQQQQQQQSAAVQGEHNYYHEAQPAAAKDHSDASSSTPSLHSHEMMNKSKQHIISTNITDHSRLTLLLSRLHDFPTTK